MHGRFMSCEFSAEVWTERSGRYKNSGLSVFFFFAHIAGHSTVLDKAANGGWRGVALAPRISGSSERL